MRIGILSDTHNQYARTERAVAALAAGGAEALVHCGDLTHPEIVHICGVLGPSYFVFGNNDFEESELRVAMAAVGGTCLGASGEIVLAGKRIAVTHGDSASQFQRLSQAQPDYLLFGHTHVALNERDGPTRRINPGALHRAATWTAVVLDLAKDQVNWIELG